MEADHYGYRSAEFHRRRGLAHSGRRPERSFSEVHLRKKDAPQLGDKPLWSKTSAPRVRVSSGAEARSKGFGSHIILDEKWGYCATGAGVGTEKSNCASQP